MKHLSFKDAILPQPPSFVKKQLYQVHEVLGTGTFGKVVVRICTFLGQGSVSWLCQLAMIPVCQLHLTLVPNSARHGPYPRI